MAYAPDRMVFPWRTSMADDTDFVASRHELAVHPGLQAATDDMLSFTGDSANIDHFDLYACFPSMVALAVEALGIDDGRPLTVSGGLGLHGRAHQLRRGRGPDRHGRPPARGRPGTTGLVHGSGGMAAKHALGLLSASPPAEPFVTSRKTPELPPRPGRPRPRRPGRHRRRDRGLHPGASNRNRAGPLRRRQPSLGHRPRPTDHRHGHHHRDRRHGCGSSSRLLAPR